MPFDSSCFPLTSFCFLLISSRISIDFLVNPFWFLLIASWVPFDSCWCPLCFWFLLGSFQAPLILVGFFKTLLISCRLHFYSYIFVLNWNSSWFLLMPLWVPVNSCWFLGIFLLSISLNIRWVPIWCPFRLLWISCEVPFDSYWVPFEILLSLLGFLLNSCWFLLISFGLPLTLSVKSFYS